MRNCSSIFWIKLTCLAISAPIVSIIEYFSQSSNKYIYYYAKIGWIMWSLFLWIGFALLCARFHDAFVLNHITKVRKAFESLSSKQTATEMKSKWAFALRELLIIMGNWFFLHFIRWGLFPDDTILWLECWIFISFCMTEIYREEKSLRTHQREVFWGFLTLLMSNLIIGYIIENKILPMLFSYH